MTPEDLQQIRGIVSEEIAASEQRTTDKLTEVVRDTAQQIAAAEERITEKLTEVMRDMQSEILRGLQAFAKGNFARFTSIEANESALNIRMAAIEERVTYLETRTPPRA